MRRADAGFSLVEMLVSLTVLLLATTSLAGLLVQNSKMNKSQQLAIDAQSNARNCLEIVVAKLRSAGWDPVNAGVSTVTLDPDLTDLVSEIEVFADVNADGETDGTTTDDDDGEQLLIRHTGNQVEWRASADVSDPFVVLAVNITNDADGDGTPEPMFVPDSLTDPERVTVRITARSPVVDPVTRAFIRYTVSSDVVFRKNL